MITVPILIVGGGPVGSAVDLDDAEARRVLDADALLLRPDLHIAWRGRGGRLPEPDGVAGFVTGHRPGPSGRNRGPVAIDSLQPPVSPTSTGPRFPMSPIEIRGYRTCA